MTPTPEVRIDSLIDALNAEQDPGSFSRLDDESAELLVVARAVKGLGAPCEPDPVFGLRLQKELVKNAHSELGQEGEHVKRHAFAHTWPRSRFRAAVLIATAAAFLIALTVSILQGKQEHVVLAMERSVEALHGYHGILQKRTLTRSGEEWLVRNIEVWSSGNRHATRDDRGIETVFDGERRWQMDPSTRQVVHLPLFPEQRGFDLRQEADRALGYPHRVIGHEQVAGRESIRIQIEPPGGEPYDLWIDADTHLPIQLRTAWSNALQTIYTYIFFEANPEVDEAVFAYRPPSGYEVIETNAGELVDTVDEASAAAGFNPFLPQEPPQRILAMSDKIVFDFGDTVMTQSKLDTPFQPETHGAIGRTSDGRPIEIIHDRLRWQREHIEIQVDGERSRDLAMQIEPGLTLPQLDASLVEQAEIDVAVDLEMVAANQKQVDGGHSPWQLDPVMTAMTFAHLQLMPEGVEGEPPIAPEAFYLEQNTGTEAIVGVRQGPIANIYLRRLIRKDETGIWTVVGYDRR